MPESNQILDENQIQSILKAGEIIAARIRYNRALFIYIKNATDLELLAYVQETNGAEYLPSLADLGMSPEQTRKSSISKIIGDIRMLCELSKLLQECVMDKTKILSLTRELRINIAIDANGIEHNKSTLDMLKKLSVNGKNGFNKQSIASAKYEYLKHAKGKLEMHALQEIQKLLIKNKVIGSFEQSFYDDFETIKVVNGEGEGETKYEACLNINTFIQLVQKNISLYNNTMSQFDRKCNNGIIKGLSIDFTNQIIQENLSPLITKLIEHSVVPLQTTCTAWDADMHEQYVANCRFLFGFKDLLDEMKSKITDIFSTEKQFLIQQEKMAAEKSKAMQIEAKRMANLETQQQEEAQQRLAQQQREQEELNKQLHILRRQQSIETRNAHEAQKAERKRLRIQEIIAKSNIKFDSSSRIMQSKFMMAPDIITANYLELCTLFDHDTKVFRYRNVERFVTALGGRLETATGSSHIRIIFSGSIYQEVDFCTDEKSVTKVAGIARPHAGETVLRNHNLTLLRDAISSVLPKEWENRYRPQISSQKFKA